MIRLTSFHYFPNLLYHELSVSYRLGTRLDTEKNGDYDAPSP